MPNSADLAKVRLCSESLELVLLSKEEIDNLINDATMQSKIASDNVKALKEVLAIQAKDERNAKKRAREEDNHKKLLAKRQKELEKSRKPYDTEFVRDKKTGKRVGIKLKC